VPGGIELSSKLGTGGLLRFRLETTRALASAGTRVVLPARREAPAAAALAGIDGVEVERLDLAELDVVVRFARRFASSSQTARILVGNAGMMASPQVRVRPAWEAQVAINHRAHFPLVSARWRRSRVTAGVSSPCRRPHASSLASGGTTSSSSAATTGGRPTARPRRRASPVRRAA
jgi:NAD(P)-dependent dehydrogenase (short-subunit alcohol dehydrogenase family)